MAELYRRPYAVEHWRQYPGGVSDPVFEKFTTVDEARAEADRYERDGAEVLVLRRTLDDDYEEIDR